MVIQKRECAPIARLKSIFLGLRKSMAMVAVKSKDLRDFLTSVRKVKSLILGLFRGVVIESEVF